MSDMKENLIRQLQNQGLTITTTSTGWLFDVQPGPTETSELPELMVTEDQCNIIQRLGTIVGIQYYYSTRTSGRPPMLRITVRTR